MGAYDDYFSEPQHFSNNAWVMNGNQSQAEAAKELSDILIELGDIEEPVHHSELKSDRVRYGFAPDNVEDMSGELCWYTGAAGKGSIPVWVYT
jgi:hypothetical protein